MVETVLEPIEAGHLEKPGGNGRIMIPCLGRDMEDFDEGTAWAL